MDHTGSETWSCSSLLDCGSGPKKAKNTEVNSSEENYSSNKTLGNSRSLISSNLESKTKLGDDQKCRILTILRSLMQHIFALPFVRSYCDGEADSERLFLDDLCWMIENNRVGSLEEFMKAVNKVIAGAKKAEGNLKMDWKTFYYNKEDIEFMADKLTEEFKKLSERSLRRCESLSEIVSRGEDDQSVFRKLKHRYKNVPEHVLLAKAFDVNLSPDVDIDQVQAELDSIEKVIEKPKFRAFKFYPSRFHDFNIDKVHHSYIAGYQFHKMISKVSKAPVHMRTILDISDAIDSITYIENDDTAAKYEEQRKMFEEEGKVDDKGKVTEVLLFHGTAVASVENILTENFIMDAVPLQLNTQNEARKKAMMYGRGIYFSELPAVSLMYGNGLLLCKVMLGNCEVFRPNGSNPPEIADKFDSREVQGVDGQGVVHVVKKPAQILPYCVINLKASSLSSQYVRNSATAGAAGCAGSCNHCSCQTHAAPKPASNPTVISQATNKTLPKSNPQSIDWNIVKTNFKPATKAEDKAYVAAETVKLLSWEKQIVFNSSPNTDLCSICQEDLDNGSRLVSLDLCNHDFHFDCLVRTVEHQPSQTYVQCPNCQEIHGIKTGNMPADGQMMWTKQKISLPGHSDCGMIMVKYTMQDGVQDDSHPHPGQPFKASSFPRAGCLPDNEQGNKVLRLLVTAWQRRLTFTVGRSASRGEDNCVIWNGIHHKTQIRDNGTGHGFPDVSYLDRVTEELRQHGITEDD